MNEQIRKPHARITGLLYLLYFLSAIAAAMLTSRGFSAAGNAVNLAAYALYASVTALFYNLFKPVQRSISLVAAAVGIVGCAVGAVEIFRTLPFHANPLFFFGFYCVLLGCLILGSQFLPRILGLLMAMAGLAWLAFLIPAIAARMTVPIEVLGIAAEGALMLWLVIMGVNVERWQKQAAGAKLAC